MFHGNNQDMNSNKILVVLNFDPSFKCCKKWEIYGSKGYGNLSAVPLIIVSSVSIL